MKRVLCGVLAVILAIGCLAGCQEGNDLNSTNESSQAISSKSNPADMESEKEGESSLISSSGENQISSTEEITDGQYQIHNISFFVPPKWESKEIGMERLGWVYKLSENTELRVLNTPSAIRSQNELDSYFKAMQQSGVSESSIKIYAEERTQPGSSYWYLEYTDVIDNHDEQHLESMFECSSGGVNFILNTTPEEVESYRGIYNDVLNSLKYIG